MKKFLNNKIFLNFSISFFILLIFAVIVVLLEMLSLITLASFGSTIIGVNNFFYKLFGLNYNFSLKEILLFLIVAFTFKNIIILFYNFFLSRSKSNLISKISVILYSFFLNTHYIKNIRKNPSILIRKINEDVSPAVEYLFLILELTKEFLILIALFFILFFTTNLFFLVIAAIFFLVLLCFYKSLKFFLNKISKEYIHSRTSIIKLLNQSFGSLKENFVYKNNKILEKKFNVNISAIKKFYFHKGFISSLPKVVFETMALFLISIYSFLLIEETSNQAEILNTIALFALIAIRMIPAFNSIASNMTSIRIHQSFFDIINLDLANYQNLKKINKNLHKNSLEITFKNSLNFQKIYFKYPNSNKYIINNSNFLIQPNKSIGLYGSSGSGKTSLMDLILGIQKSEDFFLNNKLMKTNFHTH